MEVDQQYLARVLKILTMAIAHERIENYALRILLTDYDASDASIDLQNKARELARKRYQKLLRLVDDPHSEQLDPMQFLDAFEGLMRRE
jgi:hypothetical protein